MINPKNLKKSILDYAIRGELSAKFRRSRHCERSEAISLSRHCEERSDEAISEKSSDFSGSLSTMQNQNQSHLGNPRHPNNPADYSEIASTATHSRNDGVLTAFAEITAYNAKTAKIKEQREKLLAKIDKQHKAEKDAHRKVRLKNLSGSLKTKIKSYREITPLNGNEGFTPPFEIPNTWAWVKLGDIGQVVSGGTPPTYDESNFGGDIAWITPADLTYYDKKYISHGNRKLTEKGYKASSSQLMPKGSVLFSSRAPIGYVVIASNPVCTNQGFKNIVPFSIVSSEYLYYFLKSAKETAISLASGTTFKEISAKNFAEIPIPLPPLAEQRFIAEELEQAMRACERYESTANALLDLEDGLFNKISKSVLDYAIHGELSAKYRRSRHCEKRSDEAISLSRHCEEQSDEAISEKSQDFSGSLSTMQNQDQSHSGNPYRHCEPCETRRGNLLATENGQNDNTPNGHCEPCETRRGNPPTTENEPNGNTPTVIASERSERGNLLAMENETNPHSDKGIATPCHTARLAMTGNISGSLKTTAFDEITAYNAKTAKIKEQREKLLAKIDKQHKAEKDAHRKVRLKTLSGCLKTKIKSYREITPLNGDDGFTPPFEIPNTWAWVKLGEICEISDGTHKTPQYQSCGIPFLSVKDISSGKIDFSDTKFVTYDDYLELNKRCNPQRNDILICRIGTLGKAIKIETDEKFSIFVSLGLLKPKIKNIADYLVYFFNSATMDTWIENNKAGAGTHAAKLNLTTLENLQIPLPPLAEQRFIAEELEKLLALCKKLKKA
ncbi:MAG: restriction endonuclease subunit S [Neisseriaceae bacterium]|nr:restriction endonuclease subunit S [Neisseriaceae bacterium]